MKAIPGSNKKQPDPRGVEAQRKGLLARIHIAKKDLGIDDMIYRDILYNGHKKDSAAHLSMLELEDLVRYFKELGWRPKRRKAGARSQETGDSLRPRGPTARWGGQKKSQVQTLREKILRLAANLERGEKRLPGLCEKICGTERLEWCHDVKKLEGLLAAVGKILKMEMGE